MGDLIVAFIAGTIVSWITLLVVLPIAQKFADFGLPGWRDLLWQVAIVAAATTLVYVAMLPLSAIIGWLASCILFWVLMVRWFRVDFFGAIVIMVVQFVLRMALGFAITALTIAG